MTDGHRAHMGRLVEGARKRGYGEPHKWASSVLRAKKKAASSAKKQQRIITALSEDASKAAELALTVENLHAVIRDHHATIRRLMDERAALDAKP